MAKEDSAPDTAEEPQETEGATQDGDAKTYTQAELDAEADRRATKAAETARERAKAEVEKRLAAEKERIEAERLAEQGQYRELHEKSQAELDAIKAELAAKERRETISAGLRDAGLTDFEGVLLADRTDPETYLDAAKQLGELLKTRVDAEVQKRLDTGTHATSKQTPADAPKGFVYDSMPGSA